MKRLEFKHVVTAKLSGKVFTNPKGAAKQYARDMLSRNTSIEKFYTINRSTSDADWKAYRICTNAYMKRARRRLLPIFTKEMQPWKNS